MATPVGTNLINSISRRALHPQLVDNVYLGIPAFYRANAMNKKMYQGGTQIEVPQVYATWVNGGPYQGYDLLDIAPSDTVKNAAFDMKQYYVPVSIDNYSLARLDHPEAVANGLTFLFEQAETQMMDNLDAGLWSDATTNLKALDGFKGAIDDGTVAGTYGGLSRTTNTWWKSQIDTSTTTLTLASMNALFGLCTAGGRHPTCIYATQLNYNRYWVLGQANQTWPVQPSGVSEQLVQAGFTGLVFNGVPIIVDSKIPANHIFMVNERYVVLYVKEGADMKINDFVQPPNQDAFTSLITWMGAILVLNPSRCGKMTALTA